MGQSIPVSFFQTTELPKDKKYEAFRESIGVIFEVNRPHRPLAQFDAWIRSKLIGELMLVECETVGQNFTRPASMIAADGCDHFLIQIFHQGFTVNVKSVEQRVCGPGRILILDMTRPWEALNCDFRNLTLVVPRRLLAPGLIDVDRHHGRIIDSSENPFASILLKYLISLDEMTEQILVEDIGALKGPSIDLVAATLNYKEEDISGKLLNSKSSYRLGMRFRIKEFLDQNIGTPDLGTLQLMYHFELSAEQLNLIFPEVESYLRMRRLELAYQRLLAPGGREETVEDLARSLGHKSVIDFCHSFREQYSISPFELRELAELNASGQLPRRKSFGRLWEEWFKGL